MFTVIFFNVTLFTVTFFNVTVFTVTFFIDTLFIVTLSSFILFTATLSTVILFSVTFLLLCSLLHCSLLLYPQFVITSLSIWLGLITCVFLFYSLFIADDGATGSA